MPQRNFSLSLELLLAAFFTASYTVIFVVPFLRALGVAPMPATPIAAAIAFVTFLIWLERHRRADRTSSRR